MSGRASTLFSNHRFSHCLQSNRFAVVVLFVGAAACRRRQIGPVLVGGSVAAWEYHHEPLAPFATAVPADEPDRRNCGLPRSPGQQSLCAAVLRTIADPPGLERA